MVRIESFGESTRSDGQNRIGQWYPLDSYRTVNSRILFGESTRSDGQNRIGQSDHFWQLLNRYIKDRLYGESTRSDCQNRICQSYQLDGYSTVINGHSHPRHPQVRMVRPWSLSRLRAKVGLSRPQLSRLERISRLHAKDVFNHTQLSRFERISRLRAKAGLSRPQ